MQSYDRNNRAKRKVRDYSKIYPSNSKSNPYDDDFDDDTKKLLWRDDDDKSKIITNQNNYNFEKVQDDETSPIADIPYEIMNGLQSTKAESAILSLGSAWSLLFLAVIYFITTATQIILFIFTDQNSDIKVYIETLVRVGESKLILFVVKHIGSANVFIMNASYLGVTGCFYIYYAYVAFYHKKITSTTWRYLEFGIAQSIMYLILLLEVGGREIVTIISVFACGICVMIFGYMQDKLSGIKSVKWGLSPHQWGYFPFAATWIAITIPFYKSLSTDDIAVPGYVILLYLIQFLTLPLFGISQYYYVVIPFSRGDNKINRYSQRKMDGLFHLISLVSKMCLVSISTYGIISESTMY